MDAMTQPSLDYDDNRHRPARAATIVALAVWSISLAAAPQAWADPAPNTEYAVKAVFTFDFLKFVDWPKDKVSDSNEPLIIGVIGIDEFKAAFDGIEQETVDGRKIIVKHFRGIEELERAGTKEPHGPHPPARPYTSVIFPSVWGETS